MGKKHAQAYNHRKDKLPNCKTKGAVRKKKKKKKNADSPYQFTN
jgi:hypothetical protein